MRILIATGGAPHSDLAVQLGANILKATGGNATLVTVLKREVDRAQAESILTRASSQLMQGVPGVETRIRIGQAATEILKEAGEREYDLLIVGEHPKHRLAKRLVGPTAERVIARMPCPVLIARKWSRPLHRVLVCEGGREPPLLQRLTARLPALVTNVTELTVLHVMSQIAASPGVQDWELEAEAEDLIEGQTPEGQLLEQDLELLQPLNIRLRAKVRHGLVVEEILDESKSGDYDLVVIGAHQARGWESFLLDNLARQIVAHVDRPVLVV